MREITAQKSVKPALLNEELYAAHPEIVRTRTAGPNIWITVPDEFTDDASILAIIDAHDPTGQTLVEQREAFKEERAGWIVNNFDADEIRANITAGNTQAALTELVDALEALIDVLVD